MNLVVPAARCSFDVELEDGAAIRVRRHGNPDGVRLTVTHGNGFAADVYLPFWQQLAPRYDLLVFDFRNHGQNIPVEPANHNYAQMSRDLERVLQAIDSQLGAKPTVGIFHSMSARTAMKHAIEIGWRWDGLVLFDPPNFLVLDEPTNHLDVATKEMLITALSQFEGAMLFVSHDRHFLAALSNRVLELTDDGIHRYGGGYREYVERTGQEAPGLRG